MEQSSMKWTLSIAILLWTSAASAGVGDTVPGQRYTIPGVVQTADLVTVFQCTNVDPTGFGLTTVSADVFNPAGALAGSGSVILAGGATKMISTGAVSGLTPDSIANVPNGTQGSARIIASTRGNKIVCAAYVISASGSPTVMNALPVLLNNKQKGD